MEGKREHESWKEYRERELAGVLPFLSEFGIELDELQPHIGGERELTGTGGRKLVLLGRQKKDGLPVVVKASSDPAGIAEMAEERLRRSVLGSIGFAYQTFQSPKELRYAQKGAYTVAVTEFIEQRPFLERPIEEQLTLALRAFKAQESAHAATYEHARLIRRTFGEMRSKEYLRALGEYIDGIRKLAPEADRAVLARATAFLAKEQRTLEQYCGFLTHWDFTPQNFRVRDGAVYLLDHSSLRFGNKYEGWARFINFMELYRPALAAALVQYVRDNRAPEESLSLKLMRVFRLVELIHYYAGWLPRTEGNLHELASARIAFWSNVLSCVLADQQVPRDIVETYERTRDALRSDEEKIRQRGLH